ncbi:MAG: hypothetical protein V4717_07975 [Bacteroidota bacterium]
MPFIFVGMRLFRLPKTIRWILFSALLLLVLLTVYRVVVYLLFQDDFPGIKEGCKLAFWYGLRFDLRIIGTITLLLFLFSFYPGKHYFKSEEGKKVALWISGFLVTVTLLLYAADIAYLRNFNQRLNGSIISDLAKNTLKGNVYKTKTDWAPIAIIIIAFTIMFIFLMNKMHGIINNLKGNANYVNRLWWQTILVLFCFLVIYGGFEKRPLTTSIAAKRLTPSQLALSLNPFESLLSTLPAKK